MMRKLLLIFTLALALFPASAQDSCGLKISLLTCTPGSELYSIFGHSAMRVVDNSVGTDIVYNYGTFEFDDPDFYTKFVRGKLRYFVSREAFPDFAYAYQYEGRGIDEQVVNLSCEEKREIQRFLENNIREENRYYQYDFTFDNCTTRLRDILEKYTDSAGTVKTAQGMTFRNGIHYYLDRGHMHWSKLGIDLLLGARIDRKMSNREAMFLPEFLEESMDGTLTKGRPFVEQKTTLIQGAAVQESGSLFTPLVTFSILAIVLLALSFSPSPFVQRLMKWVDKALFLVIGILGCLFLFMWFGTDHKQTAENYNLIWAWPIHIVAAFILYSGRTWIKTYFRVYMLALSLILLLWVFLPQQLNPALIPIIILLIFRSWKIWRHHGDNKATS